MPGRLDSGGAGGGGGSTSDSTESTSSDTLRENYVDTSGGTPSIEWGKLGGWFSRGFLYTMFLAVIQFVVAYIEAIQNTFAWAVDFGVDLISRVDGEIFARAADASAAAIPEIAPQFGFAIAFVVILATMWIASQMLEVP